MVSPKEFLKTSYTRLKKEGSFTHGFSWTLSGTALGFLLQIIFSPILSRIYAPQAYGEFAIYNIIVTNLISFSTLSYPDSLITCKTKEDFRNMSFLILILTFIVLIITSFAYFPFETYWINIFPQLEGIEWLPIVIVIVILSNINDVQIKWNIVNKDFKNNFKSTIPSQIISKTYQVLYGLFKSATGFGLISAEIIRALSSSYFLTRRFSTNVFKLRSNKPNNQSIYGIIQIAKDYKNYPKYIWPANWMNMFSNQLPILFFAVMFTSYEIGTYAFANSMVTVPGRLIGNAVRPVFFQRSQELINNGSKKDLKLFTHKVALYLTLFGLPAFIILFLFGINIFSFIFGNDWSLSGEVASYIAVIQVFQFSSSPISSIFYTLRKEKQLLFYQTFLFILRALSLGLALYSNFNFLNTILIYAIFNAFAYMILHIHIYRILK